MRVPSLSHGTPRVPGARAVEGRSAGGRVATGTRDASKGLVRQLCRHKYDYDHAKSAMDSVLAQALGTSVAPGTEHEWDAGISALAALEGVAGRWTHDLHKLAVSAGQRVVAPCGSTNYFWPE